jgi:GntR family transcriptional regulator / MocR family aminotransferase
MQVRTAALAGALGPGAELPSSRTLASWLGVARASVVTAYEQLAAEGIIESRLGSGTFVSRDLSALVGASRVRVKVSTAKPRPVPSPAKAFAEFERSALFAEGRPFATGRTLAACDRHCHPFLLARSDEVWVADPGYPLTHAQALLAKVRPRPIPVDRQGLVVHAGVRAAPQARAAFVTPSHQFPTDVVLSMARRLELLAWARKTGAFIIEDDYTSEFRYSGPALASLQGLDEDERVIYVGS